MTAKLNLKPAELVEKIEASGVIIHRKELARNELLKTKANICTDIFFVETGSIRLFLNAEEEQNIRFGYKNNFVVLMDSFLSGKPSAYCLQALKQTTLKIIPKAGFEQFLANHNEYKNLWQQLLEMLVQELLEREIDLLTGSPKDRYQRVFERSPQLFQEISNRHIANYLRMSPETLSRLKKR